MFRCGKWLATAGLVLGLLGCASGLAAQAPEALKLSGDVPFTHDPSIAKDGGTYYVFATGKAPDGGQFPVRCSPDLHTWKLCGHVFDSIPEWVHQRSPGTKELWAPDISHEHGEYRMYYAYSLFGVNTSGIGLAAQAPEALKLSGDYPFTHDPSIAKDGSTYYVFATGKAPDGGQFPVRCSPDLHTWKLCGHVFDSIPEWVHQRSPGTKELWAPDISHEHGEYRMYYAYSLFGVNTSGIGLAVNKTLDPKSPQYKWVDKGLVLESKASDDFNAIDPNYIEDEHGDAWLSFGSFWTGIKMRKLDAKTGMLSASDTKLYSLASRAKPSPVPPQKFDPEHPVLPPDWTAVEAPFIVRHDGRYYLFVSWDLCCRGTRSTYRTMVGRADKVTGPYLDQAGKPMAQGGGTQLLSPNSKWLGPGGESVLEDNGRQLLVFHAYDAKTGRPALQISTLGWKDGWPEAAMGTE